AGYGTATTTGTVQVRRPAQKWSQWLSLPALAFRAWYQGTGASASRTVESGLYHRKGRGWPVHQPGHRIDGNGFEPYVLPEVTWGATLMYCERNRVRTEPETRLSSRAGRRDKKAGKALIPARSAASP